MPLQARSFETGSCSELFRRYSLNGRPASASDQAVREARAYAEAKAYNGAKWPAALRVMGDENVIYIDRGTPDWSAFEVTPRAWAVSTTFHPFGLVRSRRTGEMPEPASVADFEPAAEAFAWSSTMTVSSSSSPGA